MTTKQIFELRIESNRPIDPEELEGMLVESNVSYHHDTYLEITGVQVKQVRSKK